jgi:hypothetical protein
MPHGPARRQVGWSSPLPPAGWDEGVGHRSGHPPGRPSPLQRDHPLVAQPLRPCGDSRSVAPPVPGSPRPGRRRATGHGSASEFVALSVSGYKRREVRGRARGSSRGEHLTTGRSSADRPSRHRRVQGSGRRGRRRTATAVHEELAVLPDPQPVVVPAGERGPQDLELPTLLEHRTELVSQLHLIDAAAAHRIVALIDAGPVFSSCARCVG